mgnify:CR=1 FL=1|tara:strand:+ start:59 stop:691 length:633 start_codon:yes stop_codon:yes gene_type:complete
MEIKYIKTDELTVYANNTRTHSEEQVGQLAKSIEKFGFTNPILIDGERQIIAGHGRLLAAKKMLMDEVPCIVLDHLNEDERKAYVIADNKLALNSGWDEELLKIEMGALDNLGFDLSVLGFNEVELSGLYLDVNAESFSDSFELDDGDKPPFQQITFTLADEQAKIIKEVLVKVKASEQFSEVDTHGNENSNGNLLFTLITQSQWAEQKT